MAWTQAQLQTLKDEITNDPDTRGYAGMTDAEIADDLRILRVANDREVSLAEFMSVIRPDAWPASNQSDDWNFLNILTRMDPIPLNVQTVRNRLTGPAEGVWPTAASDPTRADLIALSAETIARYQELGLPRVRTANVTEAKALP